MPGNKALIFKQVPNGLPVAGQDLTIEPVSYDASAPAPQNGVLLQSLYASFDPYLRGRMRPAHVKSYTPAFELGKPVMNRVIAKVLKANNSKFKEGDVVIGFLPFQEYIALTDTELDAGGIQRLENPLGIEDIRVFLGALGMPGLTAYSSLYEIGKPKKGETIFVSAASGAVGQLVGQLAKHEGLKVIGSVGSDDKLEFITKELGFDGGFNYKKEKPADALKRLAPEGLDIYYENVGGEHLEAALDAMKDFGRLVMCGLISNYNTPIEQHYPLRNYSHILTKRLTVRGFIVYDKGMGDKYDKEHQERVQKWIKDGSFKAVTWETQGIDNAAEGLLALFSGRNFGKAVLKF
jgi:NADPH-dependent curcumin reductase CurA